MSAAEKLDRSAFAAVSPHARARSSQRSEFLQLADELAVKALKELGKVLDDVDANERMRFQAIRDIAYIRSRLPLDAAEFLIGADGATRERMRALFRNAPKELAEDLDAAGWIRKAAP